MNDLPTIEKSSLTDPVTVTFGGATGGAVTVEANTATGATVTPLSSVSARVDPAGAPGHVDLKCVDGNGELGRARVIFLLAVTFS
jgi:hypothetical protein